ncbi:hypothetical protein [Streptomyces sp. NBC_01014]|uniref:hypothetical protein n=1 Tax=Streptomyces sp. NBC_01014 TaxID=2903719 RepID=UPI00387073AE|nr:hypothetical protein OG282_19530 [Streptomyces sp. NBC_01014]
MSRWRWEYEPDETHVVGGDNQPPPLLIIEVEKRAAEIARAAAALHPDGTRYEGMGDGVQTAFVPGGMFLFLTVPRLECVYILQVTASPI